jgi:PAS domain S-box-containing protein
MDSNMKFRWCDNVQCAVVVAEGNVYPHHKLNITFVNRHFTALFGYEAGEVIGSDVACLVYRAVDRDMHPAYVRTFCETGVDRVPAGTGRVVEGRHRDGSCILLTLTLNKNPDNEYVAFFSPAPAQIDLTPSVSSTESTGSAATSAESKLASFFDTFMTAVVHATHKDGDLCISYTNKSVTRLFGYSREECQGMKVTELIFDPEHASGHRDYVRAYEETGVSHGIVDNDVGRAVTGRHKDGYVDGLTRATSASRLGALLHIRTEDSCLFARERAH